LIDKEMADAWDKTYKHYVPLKGLEGDTDTFESAGRGFDTRGKEVQRALGRRSQAKDILAQIIADAQRAIIRSEKNQVGKSLLLLALDNPNPGLWEVTPVESNRKVDPASGKVVYTHNPKWHGDDIFIVKSKGKSYAIQLDPQLAKAMKNLGGETMNTALSYLAKLNRWLSYANTALNPEFVITNFFRDFEQSLIQLAGEHGTALAKAVASDVKGMGPMMGAFHELSGDGLSSKMTEVVGRGRAREWSDWFKKYRASGGKISYFRQESIPEQVNRINNLMRQAERTPGAYGRRMFKEAVGLIENLNGAVENAVRVATYKNAIEQGYTETEAAHMSRDLTVNFNRRGEAGVLMNSLYLFYNAAIQGNYRALSAMSNKRVQKIMGTAMVGQAMLTILNYMLAGDDEDGESLYEKIPDYEKSRNLIIMTPGGEPIKIPMPYVYSAFMSLPENIVGVAFGRKPSKATANVFHAFAESVNPLHDRNWLLMAAPTIADPFIEVWENRNFFGSPIRPESPYEDYVRPDSDKYWASVNPAALKAGKALNRITGGSDTTAGLVDISPESIEHFVEHFTGAAGAFVMRTHSFVDDPATAFSENKAPLLRKLYGANTKFYAQDQYKAAAEQIEAVQTAMDRIEREDFDEFSDFAEARRRFRGENEDILRLAPRYEATEKRLRQLYKQRREVMENKRIDEEKKEERLQEIEDRIDQARIRFNRRFNETFRQTGLG
jgi:hypothetical protein